MGTLPDFCSVMMPRMETALRCFKYSEDKPDSSQLAINNIKTLSDMQKANINETIPKE